MSARYPKFSVTILGSNSALPANGRHPTSQLLNVNNHYYLIDCGEGTQMQLRRFGLKMQRIKVIFISHMHGDHYFGLVGLLNSLHLLGRKMPLTIICPPELQEIVRLQLDAAGGKLRYRITFEPIEPFTNGRQAVFEDKQLRVEAINLKHRVRCYGFLFHEQERERTYLPEKGGKAGVKIEEIPRLKKGEDVKREDGSVVKSKDYTEPPERPRTYAFCTDTLPLDTTVDHVKHAEVLYHEATFLESESVRSKETYHSTAREAAQIAAAAQVGSLLIGHYSARYASLDEHLKESREIFPNTHLTGEGKEFEII